MNGPDLVDRLTATRPDLGVLYMTGHREDTIAYQGVLEPGVSLISKPFSRTELLARVEAMLRGKQGAMEVYHDGREADGLG
jgi:DNA-binding response OmpR family regulator